MTTKHRSHRWWNIGLGTILLVMLTLYATLAVGPFLYHDLVWQGERVVQGQADPSSLTPFNWDGLGGTIRGLALLSACFAPFICLGVAAVLFLFVVSHENQGVAPNDRRIGKVMFGVSLAAVVFMCSPLGSRIWTWLLD